MEGGPAGGLADIFNLSLCGCLYCYINCPPVFFERFREPYQISFRPRKEYGGVFDL